MSAELDDLQPEHQLHEQTLESRTSPYVTDEDWWYESESNSESDEDDADRHGHAELSGTSRAEYVAHNILKRGATLLDPISINEEPTDADLHEPGERVPVTDPCEYVPKRHEGEYASTDYGAYSKRWRVSEKYGYLCRGPVIADRPSEDLLAIVELVLDLAASIGRPVPDQEREAIRDRAERMKRDSGAHDVTIMAEVVRCIDEQGRADTGGR